MDDSEKMEGGAPEAKTARRRLRRQLEIVFAILALGTIGWIWYSKAAKLTTLEKAHQERLLTEQERIKHELVAEGKSQARELERLREGHRTRLNDPAVIDGSKAQAARAAEWERRQAHDPQFARSLPERNLIAMEKLGADPGLSAQTALEKVAILSSPPGSRLEVIPDGELFAIKVAYRMAARTYGESGAATKHTSRSTMRAEIRQISAQVVRDLFTYCGSRGISSVALTCNKTTHSTLIPPGTTAEEEKILRAAAKKTQSRLYRVVIDAPAARNISNWARATDEDILGVVKVDFDGIESLHFSAVPEVDAVEADEPLLF